MQNFPSSTVVQDCCRTFANCFDTERSPVVRGAVCPISICSEMLHYKCPLWWESFIQQWYIEEQTCLNLGLKFFPTKYELPKHVKDFHCQITSCWPPHLDIYQTDHCLYVEDCITICGHLYLMCIREINVHRYVYMFHIFQCPMNGSQQLFSFPSPPPVWLIYL